MSILPAVADLHILQIDGISAMVCSSGVPLLKYSNV
jgi:hypothetical protein